MQCLHDNWIEKYVLSISKGSDITGLAAPLHLHQNIRSTICEPRDQMSMEGVGTAISSTVGLSRALQIMHGMIYLPTTYTKYIPTSTS